jgi:hypothetical protein
MLFVLLVVTVALYYIMSLANELYQIDFYQIFNL